mmetsp:Transcript_31867/g.95375  ORF Transcript_31867/g.95375 Transcript_31867/m.95375 type:complete len:171 (+) Transcript_31867:2012-2524(+)
MTSHAWCASMCLKECLAHFKHSFKLDAPIKREKKRQTKEQTVATFYAFMSRGPNSGSSTAVAIYLPSSQCVSSTSALQFHFASESINLLTDDLICTVCINDFEEKAFVFQRFHQARCCNTRGEERRTNERKVAAISAALSRRRSNAKWQQYGLCNIPHNSIHGYIADRGQ